MIGIDSKEPICSEWQGEIRCCGANFIYRKIGNGINLAMPDMCDVFLLVKKWCSGVHLDHVPVDADFKAIALLLEGFSQHELSHPIDAIVPILDGKMMGLPGAVHTLGRRAIGWVERAVPLAKARTGFLFLGDELKAKRRDGVALLPVVGNTHRFKCGTKLGRGCKTGTSDGVVVNIDVLQRPAYFGHIFVHV